MTEGKKICERKIVGNENFLEEKKSKSHFTHLIIYFYVFLHLKFTADAANMRSRRIFTLKKKQTKNYFDGEIVTGCKITSCFFVFVWLNNAPRTNIQYTLDFIVWSCIEFIAVVKLYIDHIRLTESKEWERVRKREWIKENA